MDLNQLYSEHQILLMHAADAISEPARRKHLAAAGIIGGRIFDLLSSKEAAASVSWLPWTDRSRPAAHLVGSA
ncbi:hypothetical protein [Sphingobium bisphenolivorans]|uniref:hypothetical protein n=1 Tax=Sphingobium bisphenolivorans TaxID=1335760 RepID=UPI00039C0D55|nr:hypothetical protein [Sphingobium bisphenolivorans]